MKILELKDNQLSDLIENRWTDSDTVWQEIQKIYSKNTNIYKNRPDWLMEIPRRKSKVRANRIQVDMEAVINSLIAEPAQINILAGRQTPESQELAMDQEQYFKQKMNDRNVKKTVRKALRNLYFSRFLCIKVFWDPTIDDFNMRAVHPNKLRISKTSNGEEDSEFAIEEIDDNLMAIMKRFPKKAELIMKMAGFDTVEQAYIVNPAIKYKEAWINDVTIFKYQGIILDKIKNPYWDWDGMLVTPQEERMLNGAAMPTEGEQGPGLSRGKRRELMTAIRIQQPARRKARAALPPGVEAPGEVNIKPQVPPPAPVVTTEPAAATPSVPGQAPTPDQSGDNADLPSNPMLDYPETMKQYNFNYWDHPRKPYICATIFDNEDSPIGQTDMIDLANPLQEGVDKRKRDIDQNCELVNGITKIDASVMDQQDAQSILFEAKGIVWGKGVKDGVTRETGTALPDMVYQDMLDSRSEIDNIMRATSAFRGQRQGDETKGGRLALIQQSALSLEELVQVVDYVYAQIFGWAYHLAKIRYTEYHYAKVLGKDKAQRILSLIQDDFETGSEVRVIPGKTLPQDQQFKYDQAQVDFKQGALGLEDYLTSAGYDDAKATAHNAVVYHLNPAYSVGIAPDEMAKIVPPPAAKPPEPPKAPSESITYKDAPEDIRRQIEAQAGLKPSTVGGTVEPGNPAHNHLKFLKGMKELKTPDVPSGGMPRIVGSKPLPAKAPTK